MESRVVPASGLVSSRSSPSRRLINVDLPALGRPTIATRIGRVSISSPASGPSAASSSSASAGSGMMSRNAS
jgi:hypothetical protein